MAIDTSLVAGIVWDLDNTLYRFTDDFISSCTKAAAMAAQNLGISLSYADTLKLAERSEATHGYSMHGYVTDHGLSYASLHFPFHENIDETVVEPIKGLKYCLEKINLPQIILTNASRDWAKRVLAYTELDHLFTEDQVIPMEDVDFIPKARATKGFEIAAQKLNLPFENILMVDDLDRNLMMAKKTGMQCAYMHHGNVMVDLPSFVDAQYNNPIDLIKNIAV